MSGTLDWGSGDLPPLRANAVWAECGNAQGDKNKLSNHLQVDATGSPLPPISSWIRMRTCCAKQAVHRGAYLIIGAFLGKIFVIFIGDRCYECVQDLKTHYGDVRNARARRGLSQIFYCNVPLQDASCTITTPQTTVKYGQAHTQRGCIFMRTVD